MTDQKLDERVRKAEAQVKSQAEEIARTCKWTIYEEELSTQCGMSWEDEDILEAIQGHSWCHNCGGRVVEEVKR